MNKIIMLCLALFVQSCSCVVVDPGNRGVKVNMGEVQTQLLPEGFVMVPMTTSVHEVSVRQQVAPLNATCFSSDLQQVTVHAKVMYRIPENKVINIFRDYTGNAFDSLIAPRVQESIKEVTANLTAEQLAKQREEVKIKTLALAQSKIKDLVILEDIVIENVDLSEQLKTAIEAKMVMEQEAAKAKYSQLKAQTEADTEVIRAEGEAKAIRIRGQALRETPGFIELQVVEKWNGVSPQTVVASDGNTNLLLPMVKK